MDISTFEPYDVGPTPFQTREQPQDLDYLRYATEAEHIANPTAFRNGPGPSWPPSSRPLYTFSSIQTEVTVSDTQQEPTSPSSEGFPALTPSESISTVLSDHVVGVFGANEEAISIGEDVLFRNLARPTGYSAELLTPSTSGASIDILGSGPGSSIHNQSAVQDGSEERLLTLPEINDHNHLDFDIAKAQYAEETYAYSSAYLQQEAGRIPLPTYTSNQSKQDAPPWSVPIIQRDEGQILPDSISDKDLSSLLERCFAQTNKLPPIEVLSNSHLELVNLSLTQNYHRSRLKPQNRNLGRNVRDISRSNPRTDRRLSGAAGHHTASLATSTTRMKNEASKGGRPEGSHLPEIDRKNANEVRDQGSCFRCWCMKEKCTPGQPPCANCRRLIEKRKFRIWMTPCSSKRLEERCQYLLPAPLSSQICVPEMRSFLNQYKSSNPQKFLLSLSIGFGEPWKFWAVELIPGTHKLHEMFGFHRDSDVEQDVLPLRLVNPPIVPLWINPLLMQVNIDCWLDRMIADPQVGWQYHWFPDPSQIWQLRILEGICELYHQGEGLQDRAKILAYETLRWALKLSVLNYVMGHAFLVPEDDIEFLFRYLENSHFKGRATQAHVCPQPANKFVKMMAFPVLRLVSEKTLSGLHELLRANRSHEMIWDQTFGVVFLCLMVISSTQRSLFQRAVACAVDDDLSFSRQDADFEARNMDSGLVVYIIGMFHDKFRTSSKSKAFNPLSRSCKAGQPPFSVFAAYVKAMTDAYYRPPSSNDLSNIGAKRLLARFMQPFLSSKGGVPDPIAAGR